jgi:hypothetical protein
LNIVDILSLTECQQGRPAPWLAIVYSAPHNKRQEFCATHKVERFQSNTGSARNGSLMFWKLAPPNVIPGLVSPSRMRLKAVYEQHLG